MRSLSRRQFLRLTAGAGAALGAPQILAGCGGQDGAPGLDSAPNATTRVAAIRGKDL